MNQQEKSPSRSRLRVLAGSLALCGLALASSAASPLSPLPFVPCLDVGIPPGLPFEWEQPSRPVTGSLRMRAAQAKLDPNTTRIRSGRQVESRPRVFVEKTTAMGYARVTTVDILNHFNWNEGPKTDLVRRPTGGRTVTGSQLGEKVSAAYPPGIPLDLYWLSFAIYLRELLHPNLVSDVESLERLVEIGYPALCVIHDLGGQPVAQAASNGYVQNAQAAKVRLERWQKVLAKRVGGLPPSVPRALTHDDPERAMLLRLAAEDLAAGYASSVDATFAGRLRSLPAGEGQELLIAYAGPSTHPLLLRNAVALLGAYPTPAAQKALERVVSQSKDDVARLRAYMALARHGSDEARAAAVNELKSVSPHAALHVLGLLRAPEGVKLGLKLVKRGSYEDRLTAVRALGRIGDADKKVKRALERALKAALKTDPSKLYERPAWKADVPDPVEARRDTLAQMCLVALARLGDEESQERVLGLLQAPAPAPAGGARPFANRDPIAAYETFGRFLVPTLAFLVESLERMGPPGEARLRVVLEDRICDAGLRLAAWRALDRLGADTQALAQSLSTQGRQPALRAEALRRWAESGASAAFTRANAVLAQGANASQIERMAAAQVIGTHKGELPRQAMVIRRGGAIHAAPTRASKVVGSLPLSTRVDLVGEEEQGWLEVRFTPRGGKEVSGFAEKRFLNPEGKPRDVLLADALKAAKRVARPPQPPNAPKPAINGNPTIEVTHPLAEELAAVLGGFDTPATRAALIELLGDATQPPTARGAAAAALASSREAEVRRALQQALGAEEGWVRYCAFRALRHLGAQAPFCDWIFGDDAARAEATRALRAWQG